MLYRDRAIASHEVIKCFIKEFASQLSDVLCLGLFFAVWVSFWSVIAAESLDASNLGL